MPGHRPYARDTDAPPSVTRVLDTLGKPGLPWGAARETAEFAVRHQNRWADLPPSDAVGVLYRHHRGVWDHRALIGSALHSINALWCQGQTVRVAEVVRELRDRSPLWQKVPETELYAELLPMADGLGRFWQKARPTPLSWEQVVRYRHPHQSLWLSSLDYIGTLDWRCEIGGQPLLLDLKTTGKTKPGSAKYWDVWRLQLAAYRYATEAVLYDDQDQERGTFELPEVEGAAIVHLYGDGHCEFNPVAAGPREHETFLSLRRVYGWRQGDGQTMGNMDLAPVLGVSQ